MVIGPGTQGPEKIKQRCHAPQSSRHFTDSLHPRNPNPEWPSDPPTQTYMLEPRPVEAFCPKLTLRDVKRIAKTIGTERTGRASLRRLPTERVGSDIQFLQCGRPLVANESQTMVLVGRHIQDAPSRRQVHVQTQLAQLRAGEQYYLQRSHRSSALVRPSVRDADIKRIEIDNTLKTILESVRVRRCAAWKALLIDVDSRRQSDVRHRLEASQHSVWNLIASPVELKKTCHGMHSTNDVGVALLFQIRSVTVSRRCWISLISAPIEVVLWGQHDDMSNGRQPVVALKCS